MDDAASLNNTSSKAPIVGVPAPAGLASAFAELSSELDGVVGVAVTDVAPVPRPPIILGDWSVGPAWSTIKVPLVIAALRETNPTTLTPDMIATIRASDNEAAEAIWASLGNPGQAAGKVQAVLRAAGDDTVVQSVITAPGHSAFGQTMWPLCNQAHFIGAAASDGRNAPVLDLMAQVIADQDWGLGALAGAQFKGGWGPSPANRYLVRQFGTVPRSGGAAAVAIAAESASGSFEDGIALLDELVGWMSSRLDRFAV